MCADTCDFLYFCTFYCSEEQYDFLQQSHVRFVKEE